MPEAREGQGRPGKARKGQERPGKDLMSLDVTPIFKSCPREAPEPHSPPGPVTPGCFSAISADDLF